MSDTEKLAEKLWDMVHYHGSVSDVEKVLLEWQAARQAPASGERLYQLKSKIGGGWDDVTEDEYTHAHDSYIKRTLYTHPPAKVPEGIEAATRYIEKKASDAVILRKQAEAVEAFGATTWTSANRDSRYWLGKVNDYAQRLRQQADEAEKAGG